MALTAQGAKDAILALGDNITEKNLRAIINDLDISAQGSKTVLYSSASHLADGMKNDANIRILDKTEASKFLNGLYDGTNVEMTEALKELYDETPDFSENAAGVNKANIFISGIDGDPRVEGAWDTVSRNFVKATKGEVVLLVGEGALKERVLFQTEYPALLKNGDVTAINGIENLGVRY